VRTLLVVMLSSTLVISGGAATAEAIGHVPASSVVPSAGATGAASSEPPPGTVRVRTVTMNDPWERRLVRTGDILWTEGASIRAYNTSGTLLGAVPGFALSPVWNQALGIAASQDGSVLYAWSVADGIVAIDPATRQWTSQLAPTATPGSLVTSRDGKYLYYSYGNAGHVHVLDTATGESTEVLVTGRFSELFIGDDILVIRTSDRVATYRVDGTTLTPLATRELKVQRLALAPDGSQFAATFEAGEYGDDVVRLTTEDLVTRGTVRLARGSIFPLIWAPDGGSYAYAVSSQGPEDVIQIRSAHDDRLLSHSLWPGATLPASQTVDLLTYGRSSSVLYGFGYDTVRRFVTASTKPGLSSAFTLSRTNPTRYGKPLVARFRGAGCAPCAVRFTLKDSVAGTRTFTRTVTAGSLDLSLAVKGNGTLTASIPASLTRKAVTHTVLYNVPLRMKITMTGTYTRKGEVLVYSGARPSLRLNVGPARRVRLIEEIQFWINGRWRDYEARTLTTNAEGVLRARSRVERVPSETVRLKYTFYGDRKNDPAVVRSPKVRWR
jgi:hypothetical protein